MLEITPQEEKKLRRIANLSDKGVIGVLEEVDTIEKKLQTIESSVDLIKSTLSSKIAEVENIAQEALDKEVPVIKVKGDKGDSYVLTEADKKEIAQKVTVPVIEKVVEKTEVVKEVPSPIDTLSIALEASKTAQEAIKTLIPTLDTGEQIITKINDSSEDYLINKEKVEGLDSALSDVSNRLTVIGANRRLEQLLNVNIQNPTAGQNLEWDGNAWINSTDDAGSIDGSISTNQIAYGTGTNTIGGSSRLLWEVAEETEKLTAGDYYWDSFSHVFGRYDVLVKNTDGTYNTYISDGTDSGRGSKLREAVIAASDGASVYLVGGTYTISSQLDLSGSGSKSVSLYGVGMELTKIAGAMSAIMVRPGSYSTIKDLSITATGGNGANFGTNVGQNVTQVTVSNVYMLGISDNVVINGSGIFNIYDSSLNSEFDSIATGGSASGTISIYNSSLTEGDFGFGSAKINMHSIINNSASVVVSSYNTTMNVSAGSAENHGVETSAGTVNVYGGKITTTGGASTLDFNNGGGTINVSVSTVYDGTKTSGTITQFLINKLGVGSGATTPRGTFDVLSQTTYTIADVTTSDTLNFNYFTGNYSAGGSYYEYNIYAYKVIGSGRVYSVNPLVISATDDSSSNAFYMTTSWDATTGADGYRVVVVSDPYYGASNDFYFDTTSTSFDIGEMTDVGYDDTSGQYYQNASPVIVTPSSVSLGANFYIDSAYGEGQFGGRFTLSNDVANASGSQSPALGFRTGSDFVSDYYTGAIDVIQTSGANTDNKMSFKLYNGGAHGGTEFASLDSAGLFTSTNMSTGNINLSTINGSAYSTSPWVVSGSNITYTSNGGTVKIDNGTALGGNGLEVTGKNFTRFAVINTLGSGSGSNYNISSFSMQTNTSYVQFANYGTGTNNGTRWGISLTGVSELTHVNLSGSTAFVIGTYNALPMIFGVNQAEVARFDSSGHFNHSEGKNVILGTTTGTKIGTATTQKIGFYNSTPIVQPGATTDLGTVLSNLGLRASGTAYPITTSGAVTLTGGVTISTANLTITDKDVALSATTGTKFGTATTQKLSFYNSTPIVQPANTVAIDDVLINLGLRASGGSANFTLKVKHSLPETLKGYTVATLPAGTQGDTAFVTDATAPTYLGALTGGGAVVCPVFYNGTAWVSC